mmetsp:Transcript_11527/g.37920  ORF Transcript_11527/g.37920 Transcript_11527/m.37920 type:complete len:1082 (-) Transcript_11527:42-3287(-)
MQTAESRVGEGSDSPTARACKTGMQKLRGLFIKGSKGRLRGDGNDEEAMAGKRGTLEYNEEEEAMEEISDLPEINRSGSKPFGSGWGPASPATPRGLLGGAQPVARDASLEHHAPPEWVVTYVRLLRGRPLRWFFLLLWLSLTLSGASIYFPLTRILKISVEPPYGSESEAAKITYAENFPPEPVTLVALLSTNQRNAPNQTLINADAEMQLELLPPFFSYNPEGDLTAETESISLDLKKRVQPYLELVEWPADVASGQQAGEASAERGGTSVRASGVPAPPPSPAQLKPKCEFNFYSFFDMPFEVQMVAHSFLFPSNFGGQEGMIAVHLVSCYGHAIYKECVYKHEWFCEPVAELLESWAGYREWRMEEFPESPVDLTFVSYPVVYEDIIMGIEWGMALSTVATILAFIVLAIMLRNIRQLGLVACNILTGIGTTLLIMYPVSYYVMDVNVCAPAMLVAVALAMSIDYSLFLLTRFNEERLDGRSITQSLEIALATQGHTIVVSGATLALCFTSMLVLPTSTITSMAAGAATAVLQSVLVSLSLTPALLLTMPRFFTADRMLGLTLDGTPFGTYRRASSGTVAQFGATIDRPTIIENPQPKKESIWAHLGRCSQRGAPVMFLFLALVMVPFAMALTRFSYVEDLTPLMQTTHPATKAFISISNIYGQDLTTPVQLLIMAPSQKAMASREWSLATCHMLQDLATKVTDRMHEEGHDYTMTTADFNGLMIFRGGCLADGLKFGVIDVMPAVHMYGMYDMVADLLSNRNQTATQVYVHCQVDLFSEVGEAWMRAVRASLPRPEVIRQPLGGHQDADSANYVPYGRWDDVEIGALHLYGMPLEQMDGAQYTLRRMPYVGLAIAAIVCIILGGSFGTALIPVRAVICIAWMLVVTFGASVMVYQLGYLEGLGIQALSPSSGQALFWISPSVAVAVLVGLGLDYDIFLMDSVMEHWQSGKDGKSAVVTSLDQAGTIISAAGIIMFLAFGALLASTTPVLNQIGFMLCVGVLLDCFVTTKVTIPCLMALVPDDANFWPLKQSATRELAIGREPSFGLEGIGQPPGFRRSLSWKWKYGVALEHLGHTI